MNEAAQACFGPLDSPNGISHLVSHDSRYCHLGAVDITSIAYQRGSLKRAVKASSYHPMGPSPLSTTYRGNSD